MNLVLSSDAKPRLKWTQELHQRFIDAVNQLGGPEKATPKSLMRVMAISGLTLYHLKSHLQKYRLGRSQQSQTCHQSQQQEVNKISVGAQEKMNDLQVAEALQIQMDVQNKLHEQIEVQRHLQLRIEAQGKYLQSVLKKAQDTLYDYSEVEQVKAQLAQLLSMVNSGSCPVICSLTETTTDDKDLLRHKRRYSVESSLTSSDSSVKEEEAGSSDGSYKQKANPVVLSLMEMHPAKNHDNNIGSDHRKNGDFDLNSKCVKESDSGIIDLNCNGCIY